MALATRYQAAIVKDDHLLLLKVNDRESGETFWVIPGGNREPGETEEECILREVREETHLSVEVECLILDEPAPAYDTAYEWQKTYRCRVVGGDPRPGTEPEVDTADHATIADVRWFDLRDSSTWDPLALNDPITHPLLKRLKSVLGYTAEV